MASPFTAKQADLTPRETRDPVPMMDAPISTLASGATFDERFGKFEHFKTDGGRVESSIPDEYVARSSGKPFDYLELDKAIPPDRFARMVEQMPESKNIVYRSEKGRTSKGQRAIDLLSQALNASRR